MAVIRPDGHWVQRGWRPTLMWWLLVTVAVPFGLFISTILAAVAYGIGRSVITGQPMPDITGGLDRVLAPAMPYIASGLGALLAGYLARGRQIVQQGRAEGGQGQPPFAPSSPPFSESITQAHSDAMPNPHGGPDGP